MTLTALLQAELQQKKTIAFADYMQLALYHPQFGYYSGGLPKFGRSGDFITAPELTPLFGQTLANQCQPILENLSSPILFEFGAGSGRLCVDLLSALEQKNALPEAYHILEVSSNLRQRQKALITEEIPHLLSRIQWLDHWPKTAFNGVVIANEVLDAMPVHRFLQTNDGLFESFVTLNANGQLTEVFLPCNNNQLQDYITAVLPKTLIPYQSEASLLIKGWLQQCYDMLNQGVLLIIDYGFPRHEYYHPDRNQGTLMCHYQHKAHSNPLIHSGLQDITAHIDFTLVAEAGDAAGFTIAGYTSQAAFLIANGLLNLLENSDNTHAALAVKQLIQPHEMGELFKVMALSKQWDYPLAGFQLYDKRMTL